jgi:ankyrin repeat protein
VQVSGVTPLMRAAEMGQMLAAQLLLQKGSNHAERDKVSDGDTIL